jgi:hypothetical protein
VVAEVQAEAGQPDQREGRADRRRRTEQLVGQALFGQALGVTATSERERAWTDAAQSLDIEPAPRRRPDPFRWVRYAFWGSLPERYSTWILYDATCSTWVLRHLLRLITIAVLPIAAVVVFLPGPVYVRVLTAVVAGLGGLLFAAVWVNEATDQRLVRAGWPTTIGPELRRRRSEIADWIASVRRL